MDISDNILRIWLPGIGVPHKGLMFLILPSNDLAEEASYVIKEGLHQLLNEVFNDTL